MAMEREKQKEISRPDHCLLNSKTYQSGPSELCGIEGQTATSGQNVSGDITIAMNGQKGESFFLKVSE